LAVFALVFLAPIPSELILPMAGYLAGRDPIALSWVALAGAAAYQASALFWYGVGRGLGEARVRTFMSRFGQLAGPRPDDLDKAVGWFRRYGPAAVLIGRGLPAIRAIVCVPAGLARMPLKAFFIWSAIGSLLWCAALTGAGWLLAENYGDLKRWLDPITWTVLGVLLGLVVFRKVRRR
jgi:membrane protein DedA with SNARE-associated domain